MADDRYTIRHQSDGAWDIADGHYASLPDKSFAHTYEMDLMEAERVVLLMNELDKKLRERQRRHGSQ